MIIKGVIKYDDKHDNYFVWAYNNAYSLFLFDRDMISDLESQIVEFEANSYNEVTSILNTYSREEL